MSKKTIQSVFGVIGSLVVCLLLWAVVFNDGGVLATGYNAIATPINTSYQKLTGGTGIVIPLWTGTNNGGSIKDGEENIK